MFKTLIASAALAATSLVAPAAVEARTSHCYETVRGADVCILSVQRHKSSPYVRLVKSSVDGHVSYDQVTCNPAHRHNYKENMAGIACFQFHF